MRGGGDAGDGSVEVGVVGVDARAGEVCACWTEELAWDCEGGQGHAESESGVAGGGGFVK